MIDHPGQPDRARTDRAEAGIIEIWVFDWGDGQLAREFVFGPGHCHSQLLTAEDCEMIQRFRRMDRVNFETPEIRRQFLMRVLSERAQRAKRVLSLRSKSRPLSRLRRPTGPAGHTKTGDDGIVRPKDK